MLNCICPRRKENSIYYDDDIYIMMKCMSVCLHVCHVFAFFSNPPPPPLVGKIILADGKIILAGGKIILEDGKIILAGQVR